MSGNWVAILARMQAVLPLSASVLLSCLFINRFPSVYTYDREQRAKVQKLCNGKE